MADREVWIGKKVADLLTPWEAEAVGLYSVTAFAISESVRRVECVERMADFAGKTLLIQRVAGRDGEALMLYYFTPRVDPDIEEKATACFKGGLLLVHRWQVFTSCSLAVYQCGAGAIIRSAWTSVRPKGANS